MAPRCRRVGAVHGIKSGNCLRLSQGLEFNRIEPDRRKFVFDLSSRNRLTGLQRILIATIQRGTVVDMNILSLSFGYHDSAAVLLQDGLPTYFASEERFSYQKNDARFPHGAVQAAMRHGSVSVKDLDAVVYYEDPLWKMDGIASIARRFHPEPDSHLRGLLKGNWDRLEKLNPLGMIERSIGSDQDKIEFVPHHLSHAALSYFLSPFNRAIVITIDGVGEYATLCVYLGQDGELKKLASMSMPDSLGLLYSFFTGFCGFEINEGEYKLMELAAFGEPQFHAEIGDWVDLHLDKLVCSTRIYNGL